jgi:hypothetical protein
MRILALALPLALTGCAHVQPSDFIHPAHLATVEACREIKLRKVAEAETREEAEEALRRTESRCAAAYFGLTVAQELLEDAR